MQGKKDRHITNTALCRLSPGDRDYVVVVEEDREKPVSEGDTRKKYSVYLKYRDKYLIMNDIPHKEAFQVFHACQSENTIRFTHALEDPRWESTGNEIDLMIKEDGGQLQLDQEGMGGSFSAGFRAEVVRSVQ